MLLINCKVELKPKLKKHCVLSVLGNKSDNANVDSNNIVFTINDVKLCVLLSLYQQRQSKIIKTFYQIIWKVHLNEYKTKGEIKNTTNEYRYFIELTNTDILSKFVGINRLLVFIYPNQDGSVKRFNGKMYFSPTIIVTNYNDIVNGKNFYDQPIDSNIKRYKEIRKLTTG